MFVYLIYVSHWCVIQQDGKKLVSGSNMQIDRVSGRCSLHIKAVTGDDEGEYMCEACNEFGVASTSQQLLVNCRYLIISVMSWSCLLPSNVCVLLAACIFACCFCVAYSRLQRPMSKDLHIQGGPKPS